MKKWILVFLTLAMVFTATACACQKKEEPQSLSGTMEETVTKIMAENPAEFMGGTVVLNLADTTEDGLWALKSYTGLTSGEKITDAAVYEPVANAQAFSLVLVRVAASANPKEVAQQMKDNIDTRKWICAQADQVMVAGYGDVVMFIMVDSQLGKTAQSYVDAFEKVCGSKPDFTL